jgi:hypothetical protein
MRFVHILPAVVAAGLLSFEVVPVRDLIFNADPTLQGSLSFLNFRPLLSVAGHLSAVTLALYLSFAAAPATRGAKTGIYLCYGALAVELLALVPCLVFPSALCGVYYLLINQVAAPVMMAGLAVVSCTAGSRALAGTTLVAAVALVATGLVVFWGITPKSAGECDNLGESLKRDACVMNFALRHNDETLCERINFDSSRWSCLYQIAERKDMPALCEQITRPCRHISPGLACEPDLYRDTCYLVVARKIRDKALCSNVTDPGKRASCESQSAKGR